MFVHSYISQKHSWDLRKSYYIHEPGKWRLSSSYEAWLPVIQPLLKSCVYFSIVTLFSLSKLSFNREWFELKRIYQPIVHLPLVQGKNQEKPVRHQPMLGWCLRAAAMLPDGSLCAEDLRFVDRQVSEQPSYPAFDAELTVSDFCKLAWRQFVKRC